MYIQSYSGQGPARDRLRNLMWVLRTLWDEVLEWRSLKESLKKTP